MVEVKQDGLVSSSGVEELKSDPHREYIEQHKTELNDDDMTLYPKAKSGCKHCHGTGREGWNFFGGEPVICRCILRRLHRKDNKEFMSWKEFKELTLSRVDDKSRKTKHLTPKSLRRALGKKVGKYAKLGSQISEAVNQEEDREASRG